MPMMRRGPLDRYPMEWVLRQASAHQSSGSIEFNTSRPVTVYLRGGRIHHAIRGIPLAGEPPPTFEPAPDEANARATVVEILASALGAGGGWYYHDPLAGLDDHSPWHWDIAALLLDARIRSHEDDALGPWAGADVALHLAASPTPITLGADGWAVVVALAATTSSSEVRRRLGWTSERLVAALDDLGASGALRPDAPSSPRPTTRPDAPSVDPAAAAAAVAAAEAVVAKAGTQTSSTASADVAPAPAGPAAVTPPARHVGPLAPPPVLAPAGAGSDDADERRSALRRLISSLRST